MYKTRLQSIRGSKWQGAGLTEQDAIMPCRVAIGFINAVHISAFLLQAIPCSVWRWGLRGSEHAAGWEHSCLVLDNRKKSQGGRRGLWEAYVRPLTFGPFVSSVIRILCNVFACTDLGQVCISAAMFATHVLDIVFKGCFWLQQSVQEVYGLICNETVSPLQVCALSFLRTFCYRVAKCFTWGCDSVSRSDILCVTCT